MRAEKIIERAKYLHSEHGCENVFITGSYALVCLGMLSESQQRSPMYLDLPAICHGMLEHKTILVDRGRFDVVKILKDSIDAHILPPETTLTDSGLFVKLEKGIWIESLESFIRNHDSDLYEAVCDHLQMNYSE